MRYEVMTSLTPEEVIEHAIAFFGPGSTGLELTSQTHQGVVFQGGGGYVAIRAQPGTDTTVDIETREWDYPVRQFMTRIGRRRWWSNWWRRRSRSSASQARAPEPKPASESDPIFRILNHRETDYDTC
jgi:hypothetical protein